MSEPNRADVCPAMEDEETIVDMGALVKKVKKLGDIGDDFELMLQNGNVKSKGQAEFKSDLANIRLDLREFVIIYVGKQMQEFFVHKGLICRLSYFFRATFRGSFKEASEGAAYLPTEKPKIFEIVYGWLYSKALTHEKDGRQTSCQFSVLLELYVFGDKYGIPSLRNTVVSDLTCKAMKGKKATAEMVKYVYDNTSAGSKLRMLLVDMEIGSVDIVTFYKKHQERYEECPEFLTDIFLELARLYQTANEFNLSLNFFKYYEAEGGAAATVSLPDWKDQHVGEACWRK